MFRFTYLGHEDLQHKKEQRKPQHTSDGKFKVVHCTVGHLFLFVVPTFKRRIACETRRGTPVPFRRTLIWLVVSFFLSFKELLLSLLFPGNKFLKSHVLTLPTSFPLILPLLVCLSVEFIWEVPWVSTIKFALLFVVVMLGPILVSECCFVIAGMSSGLSPLGPLLGLLGGFWSSTLVVFGSLFRVTNDRICVWDFFKLFRSSVVIFVGVVLLC